MKSCLSDTNIVHRTLYGTNAEYNMYKCRYSIIFYHCFQWQSIQLTKTSGIWIILPWIVRFLINRNCTCKRILLEFFSCWLSVFCEICNSFFFPFLILISDDRRRYDISVAQSCRIQNQNYVGNARSTYMWLSLDNLFFVVKINPSNKNKTRSVVQVFGAHVRYLKSVIDTIVDSDWKLRTDDSRLETDQQLNQKLNWYRCYRRLDGAIVY